MRGIRRQYSYASLTSRYSNQLKLYVYVFGRCMNNYIKFCYRSNRTSYSVFPFYIGKIKITIFHFLLACTIIFSLVWGFFIYSVVDAALKKAGDTYAASSDTGDEVKNKPSFYGTKFRIM